MDSKLPPLDVTPEETEDAILALQDDFRASELAELYCRRRQLEDALTRLEKATEALHEIERGGGHGESRIARIALAKLEAGR
jgi:hypothetical protein